jgi:putative urate catabolism protein
MAAAAGAGAAAAAAAAGRHPPRDLIGYGPRPPHAQWPGDARVAVQLVLNYEEGGENCVLDNDGKSEYLLSDISGAQPLLGVRHMNMESLYEYGSRAGFWRLHRLFTELQVPVTVYAVGLALERNPDAALAMKEAGWEVASHGYRWIDYQYVGEDTEREHIRKTIEVHKKLLGERPLGIYQGKPNVNTRRLVVEEGGFLYDSDSYADDLPFWNFDYGRPHLIIPYTLEANDMRFNVAPGFVTGDDFYAYLRDAFDTLYEEGKTSPKMMSVGLHCRIVGRPGRIAGLRKFLEYIKTKPNVWICRRIDIARHWYAKHPPRRDSKL